MAAFAHEAERAGFGLLQSPMFEDAEVFRRGIGEDSEVVGKEMYEFADRDGQMLALRPEGTASVVRAFVEHHPLLPWKAWYVTPAFRHERPQAGRYRQHHQVGVEALGAADPDLDVEVVALADDFYRRLGLSDFDLEAQLDGRRRLPAGLRRAALLGTRRARATELCDEHRPTARGQPAAGPRLQAPGVPGGHRRRAASGRPPVRRLRRPLRPGAGGARRRSAVPYGLDHRLVRGFDYYTRTTFEFASGAIEAAQNAIGGGGRYDGLVEMLGGPPTPGIGFGIGIERVLIACDAEGVLRRRSRRPLDAFVVDVAGGETARDLAAALRRAGPAGRPGLRRPVA